MIEDKYIYSFIKVKKNDIALKLLYFFSNKSNKYRLVLYNSDKKIINAKNDYLKYILDVIAGIKEDFNICPCYLELYDNSTLIFRIDTEMCIVGYLRSYNKEYIDYIISLVGKYNKINSNYQKINNLISNLELNLQNQINYFKAGKRWGFNNVILIDYNLLSVNYKELFDLYPQGIIDKINYFKDGNINEDYFQDIIYQNILIKLSISSDEENN